MRPLGDAQAAFAAALRDPAESMPVGLVGPDGRPASRRFAVYRNNVTVGLIGALASSFPVIERIVGAEFFAAMGRAYIAAEPPRSPLLLNYGAGFPAFIDSFEPAASLPYLADVARIERAWREAYHAEDATPLAACDFAGLAASDIPRLVLRLHPSLRVLTSRHPARTIWTMHASGGAIEPIDFSVAEDCLIVRPDADVAVRSVPPGGAVFVRALADGVPLHAAVAAAVESDRSFDLAANLAGLIGAGAVAAFTFGDSGGLQ